MLVVHHFTHDEAALEGKPVRILIDRETSTRPRMFVFIRSGMSEDDIGREVSVEMTRHVQEQWLHMGGLLEQGRDAA